MKRRLAIDPGRVTGFAHNDSEGRITFGSKAFRSNEFVKCENTKDGLDFLDFWRWINRMIVEHKIDSLHTELWSQYEGMPTNQHSMKWLYHSHNCLKMAAVFNSIKYENVSLQLWRGGFTGVRSISKADDDKFRILCKDKRNPNDARLQMRSKFWKDTTVKTCKLMGLEVKNHNAADAVGILHYFLDKERMDLFGNG